ncbi:MAG: hypothetical protein P4N59_17975 [Negativicutes bacterium]|nr:hypothetical protein [Negativicutes bacterium]
MAKGKRVGVIHGGWTPDTICGRKSAADIIPCLLDRGYEVVQFDIDYTRVNRQLREADVDVVINQTAGKYGETGMLQHVMGTLGIPYTGSGPLASMLSHDKLIWKQLLAEAGLETIPFMMFHLMDSNEAVMAKILATLGLPVILKPVDQGFSIGVFVAQKEEELDECITQSRKYGENTLVEKYLAEGTEIDVGILERKDELIVFPTAEYVSLDPQQLFCSTADKLAAVKKYRWEIPAASLSADTDRLIGEYTKRIFRLLRMSGFARIDFMVAGDAIYASDIALLPTMARNTQWGKGLVQLGIEYADFAEGLITNIEFETKV